VDSNTLYVATALALMFNGWLIGSIPIGWAIAKRKFGVDLLKAGSGGIGETNFVRTVSAVTGESRAKKWGYIVQACDQLKGLIPILLGVYLLRLDSLQIALLGVGLIMGHSYSAFLRLRGGKGVATTMGVALGLFWPAAVVCYVYWFAIKKLMAKTTAEATAIASIRAAILLGLLSCVFIHDHYLNLLFAFAVLHIVFAHRANIRRFSEEQATRKRFPDDMPVGVFMSDSATNDPGKIRGLLEQKYGFAKHIPLWFFQSWLFHLLPLSKLKLGEVIVTGRAGKQVRMLTWGFPWTPAQMMANPEKALRHLVKLARYLEKRGVNALCLGAFTAIVGDKGESVAESVGIPVFNGNRLTGALAALTSLDAGERMGWGDPRQMTVAVIGGGGSVGQACAKILLAYGVKKLLLVGRVRRCLGAQVAQLNMIFSDDPENPRVREVPLWWAVERAGAIICATSADHELPIDPNALQPGAVITDMARPRNVSRKLAEYSYLLPNDGALVEITGKGSAGLGLPPGVFFPCWSELALALLEGWQFDWVDEPRLAEMELVLAAFEAHHFRVASLRLNEQPLSWADVGARRSCADAIRKTKR